MLIVAQYLIKMSLMIIIVLVKNVEEKRRIKMSDEKIIVVQQGKLQNIGTIALILLVLGLIVVGYFGYKRFMEDNERLRAEVVEFKNLTETLARASNKWVTNSDLEKHLKNVLTKDEANKILSDLRKQGARLESLGKTIGTISGKVSNLEKSDSTEVIDENQTKHTKNLKDSNDAPVGSVSFTTNKSRPWDYKLYERKYTISTIVGKKDSGQFVFYHNAKYSIPSQGKKEYKIQLQTSEFLQQKRSNKFYWLNPKLDVSVFGGGVVYGDFSEVVSFGADIGLSLSSYGYTQVDSLWRFFRVGAGYDAQRGAFRVSFAPAELNIGRLLPFFTNLYLVPSVGFDTNGGATVTMGIGFQL